MTKRWKLILVVSFSLVIVLIAGTAIMKMNTKKHSPADKAVFSENGLHITTDYCRPYKKGRLIFGSKEDGALQPFGTYWRLGANEATTFEINKDVIIAGNPLKAGIYSIYAVPGEKTWEIGVNSEAHKWGAAEPDHAKDVLTFNVPASYNDQVTEQLKINYQPIEGGAEMVIIWDNATVKFPILLEK